MTNSSDKQERVDWLEISESVGVDVSREIEAWFNNAVEIEGALPIDDGIKTEVSAVARELAQNSGVPVTGRTFDPGEDATTVAATGYAPGDRSLPTKPSTIKATHPSVSKEKSDAKRAESMKNNNELGLDWGTPVSKTTDSQSAGSISESAAPRGRKANTDKKSRETAGKPDRTTLEPVKPAFDMSGWDNLESELGITPRKPAESSTSQQESVTRGEEDAVPDFGHEPESAKSTKRTRQSPQQKSESQKANRGERHPVKQKPAGASGQSSPIDRPQETSPFGAGLVDLPDFSSRPTVEAKSEKPEYIEPLGFFDSPESQADQSELRLDESEIEVIDIDESPEEPEDELVESAWDEDFVEFEIEDLHPNPRRDQASRDRENRDTRSGKVEKPPRERVVHDEDDVRNKDLDSAVPKRHSTESENDEGQTKSKRSSRRRKPRGRRRSGERSLAGETSGAPSTEDANSTRTQVAKSKPENVDNPNDDFDDDFENDVPDEKARSTKPRNLPTWNETVDVIVQSNIASRKKQPPRRRKGGGGQGGPNRHR